MDNETKNIFEMLIKKLDSIEEIQKSMIESQKSMVEIQKSMVEIQKSMIENQNGMEERQKNMEIRQDEIFSVVKAIEHSNTIQKAEIDNIIYKVAHTEGTINKIGNFIVESRAIK